MNKKKKFLLLIIVLMIIGVITLIYRKPIPYAKIIFVAEIGLLILVCWKYGKICPKCGGDLVETNREVINSVSYIKYERSPLSASDKKEPVTYLRTDYNVTYTCSQCGYEQKKREKKDEKA